MAERFDFPPRTDTKERRLAYKRDCFERIIAGESVWMQRTFEADRGRVFDYYQNGAHQGFVDQEDGICDAYLIPVEGVSLVGRPVINGVDLQTAAQALFDAVQERLNS